MWPAEFTKLAISIVARFLDLDCDRYATRQFVDHIRVLLQNSLVNFQKFFGVWLRKRYLLCLEINRNIETKKSWLLKKRWNAYSLNGWDFVPSFLYLVEESTCHSRLDYMWFYNTTCGCLVNCSVSAHSAWTEQVFFYQFHRFVSVLLCHIFAIN